MYHEVCSWDPGELTDAELVQIKHLRSCASFAGAISPAENRSQHSNSAPQDKPRQNQFVDNRQLFPKRKQEWKQRNLRQSRGNNRK